MISFFTQNCTPYYQTQRSNPIRSHGTGKLGLPQAMGLSKSSLYQGFGGKKELFLRCIDRYGDMICKMMRSRLESSGSGLEFIEELLLSSASEAKRKEVRRGCLLMNTATEFAQTDPR